MAGSVVGRETELAAVDAVLAATREELSVLVLEGEAGIGKTTVWREGMSRAAGQGFQVLSCRPAPAEVRMSFAALGDLLGPVEPAAFEALPDPQRRALDVALLRVEAKGAPPDLRAIGTGVVSLVSALAREAPVLLAVDDVQWLDPPTARALEFALRRLDGPPVAVLATFRTGERSGLSVLVSAVSDDRIRRVLLGPLSLGALYQVLKEQLGHGLPRPLMARIERATGGNPFYAVEIARVLESEGHRASGRALPVPDDLRELVARRLRRLPPPTRTALLKSSALAQPTVSQVDPSALAPAEAAGVVGVRADGRIEFLHPLYAGALYAGASWEQRRRLHGELAELVSDMEERARHLALATDGPDERVASVLDAAAEHAHARGAPEVAAELAEQAAQRSVAAVAEARSERCLRAGRYHLRAGDRARAKALAEKVIAASPPPEVLARALHLLAEVCAVDSPETAIRLLEDALACAGDDAGQRARLEVSLGILLLATLDVAGADVHLHRAVKQAAAAGVTASLAEAIAMRAMCGIYLGRGVDDEELQRALALEDPDREVMFQMRPSFIVAQVYEFTGEVERARGLLLELRERIVARGEESDLPWVLAQLGATAWQAGDLADAEAYFEDALSAAELTGQELFRAFALLGRAMVRAVRGDVGGAHADGMEALSVSERIGWPAGVGQSRYALGLLALTQGEAQAAVAMLEPSLAMVEAVGVYEWPIAMSVPDAIEAFIATGEVERAAGLTDALYAFGRRIDRPWALATSGRCRALLDAANGELESAQTAAERALVDHERLPMPFELGRTLLVLGQVQRRRGERRVARETLARALAVFEELGAPVWAVKTEAEMLRIGVRRAPEELTENELRAAELAAQGLTNPEIAGKLFVSRRTVEANLARAYRKLGVRSRAELGATMAGREHGSS
jgi:DNA-binding CsgD family transcriptional regulator